MIKNNDFLLNKSVAKEFHALRIHRITRMRGYCFTSSYHHQLKMS